MINRKEVFGVGESLAVLEMKSVGLDFTTDLSVAKFRTTLYSCCVIVHSELHPPAPKRSPDSSFVPIYRDYGEWINRVWRMKSSLLCRLLHKKNNGGIMLKTLFNPPDASGGKKIFFVLIASFLLSSPCLAGEWNLTGSLNQGRECFCSVKLDDGRILVAGGYNSGPLSSCEIYNPNTGQWSPTDSMNYARMHFSLTKLSNGKILATAGSGINGSLCGMKSEIFDPLTEIWSQVTTLNCSRDYHSAVLLQNGKVLVVGGDNANDYKGCEIYDPQTNEWTLTGFCIYQKVDHTLELLPDGRVMAIGGGNSNYEHCEIYDPNTEIWTEIDDLNEPRYSHTSHLLPNGNVMAIAGAPSPYRSSCEIYDFQTQQWSFTDSLEIGRTGHCSETLLNNKILVMGGSPGWANMSCEIYNPITNQWQTATSLNYPKYNFSTEILNDERVLAIRGWCEIYTWNYQPIVSQPQGPSQGTTGDALIFSVTASDPDNDSIAVRIDWGNGEISDWTELQPSGSTFELSHSWAEPGVYQVRAQVADQWYFLNEQCHNSLSYWTGPTIITITGNAVDPSPHSLEPMLYIYPNPFNDYTTISFSVTQSSSIVSIEIYNIKGQKIRTLECDESLVTKAPMYRDYSITWDGTDDNNLPVESGIYFYKLMIGNEEIACKKMLLLK